MWIASDRSIEKSGKRFFADTLARWLIWLHLVLVIVAAIAGHLLSQQAWYTSFEEVFGVCGLLFDVCGPMSMLLPPVLFIVALTGQFTAQWSATLLLLSLVELYVSVILLLPSVQ
jgi:hypothetical protein